MYVFLFIAAAMIDAREAAKTKASLDIR